MTQETITTVTTQGVNQLEHCRLLMRQHVQTGTPTLETLRDHFVQGELLPAFEFDRLLTEERPAQGFGDFLARVTQATGIDKLAQVVANAAGQKDCGCGKRREVLNAMLPFTLSPQERETEE